MNETGKKTKSEYHLTKPPFALLPSQVSSLVLSVEENGLNLSRVPFHTLSTPTPFSRPIFPVTAPDPLQGKSLFPIKMDFLSS